MKRKTHSSGSARMPEKGKRILLLSLGMLVLGNCVFFAAHQPSEAAWSEPAIAPIMMSEPLTPPPVTGTTYYVDKRSRGGACSDSNAGTISQPWCTIRKAMQTLRPGDRAYVRRATYNEGSLWPSNAGTAGNYITLKAYPGETVSVNCSGNNSCINGRTGKTAYWVFDGFDMYSGSEHIIDCSKNLNCHHIWLVNNKLHEVPGHYSAIQFSDGSNNNVVSNNLIYNVRGQAIGVEYSGPTIIEFNMMYDNGRDADDGGAINCHRTWQCVMRYNQVYRNYRNPNSPIECYSPGNCQGVTGLYIDVGVDNTHGSLSYIYNNTSYNNDIGIQIYKTRGARVFNNVVYNNGLTPGDGNFVYNFGQGITFGSADPVGTEDVWVENNTVVGNKRVGINLGNAGSGIHVRNNILASNGGNISSDGSGYDITNNLINNSRVTFVNRSAGDFQPAAGSAAINAGKTVSHYNYDRDNKARPQGNAYDVGAYEYGGASASPTPPQPRLLPRPSP
jgi:parallel beta-helix repeat protein